MLARSRNADRALFDMEIVIGAHVPAGRLGGRPGPGCFFGLRVILTLLFTCGNIVKPTSNDFRALAQIIDFAPQSYRSVAIGLSGAPTRGDPFLLQVSKLGCIR